MIVNDPDIVAEVAAEFAAYERALTVNDVGALDGFFHASPTSIRYGGGENLYGIEEIRAFRAARTPPGARELDRTEITAYGRDLAVAATLFRSSRRAGQDWPADADLGENAGRLAHRRRACERDRRIVVHTV